MTSNIDIYRTANEYIKQHGEDAAIFAAMRSDELLSKGDMEGHQVWIRIMRAIDELQTGKVPEGASVH